MTLSAQPTTATTAGHLSNQTTLAEGLEPKSTRQTNAPNVKRPRSGATRTVTGSAYKGTTPKWSSCNGNVQRHAPSGTATTAGRERWSNGALIRRPAVAAALNWKPRSNNQLGCQSNSRQESKTVKGLSHLAAAHQRRSSHRAALSTDA